MAKKDKTDKKDEFAFDFETVETEEVDFSFQEDFSTDGGADLPTRESGEDAVVHAKKDISATWQAFKDAAKKEQTRVAVFDSEFWFAVCFKSREQKEEFLRKMKLMTHGDKYLDGKVVAKAMGFELATPDPNFIPAKLAKRWLPHVRK